MNPLSKACAEEVYSILIGLGAVEEERESFVKHFTGSWLEGLIFDDLDRIEWRFQCKFESVPEPYHPGDSRILWADPVPPGAAKFYYGRGGLRVACHFDKIWAIEGERMLLRDANLKLDKVWARETTKKKGTSA